MFTSTNLTNLIIMNLTYCDGHKARMFLKELGGQLYSLTVYDKSNELRVNSLVVGSTLKALREFMDSSFRNYQIKMDRVVSVERTDTCYRGVLSYRDGTKKYQKCLCNELGLAFEMAKQDKTFKDSVKVEAEKVYLHHLSDTSVEEEPTGEYIPLLSRRSYQILSLNAKGECYKGQALNVHTRREERVTLYHWIDGVVLDTERGIVQGKMVNTPYALFIEEEYL